MKIFLCVDAAQATALAGAQVQQQIMRKPESVLGFATGGTMEALYAELIRLHRHQALSFAGVRSFNLDEYLGLSGTHSHSYSHYMHQHLFDHVNIQPQHIHLLQGDAADPVVEAQAYEQRIQSVDGIDLQLLGLGENGHIGFNEPSSSLASRTRVKRLAPDTLAANQRYFSADISQPTHALTMGIGTIMDARQVVMLALGTKKADAVAHMIEGPISARWPASVLQMHPQTTVILDAPAAQHLACRDYYTAVHPMGLVE